MTSLDCIVQNTQEVVTLEELKYVLQKDKPRGYIGFEPSHSVASPYKETENMKDGSDAIADWPLLNALLNCAAGADSVQIHNGGGVSIGLSTHVGMVVVCYDTDETDGRIQQVFTTDPSMGVARHVDAGYDQAIATAQNKGIKIPMR